MIAMKEAGMQHFAEDRRRQMRIGAGFPRLLVGVDREEAGVVGHRRSLSRKWGLQGFKWASKVSAAHSWIRVPLLYSHGFAATVQGLTENQSGSMRITL
jgi:hypothetical protein